MALGADVNLGFIRFEAANNKTIASGVLTVDQSMTIVNGEGAANDNLDRINIDTSLTMPSGYTEMLILRAATGLTITIRDAQDNILTNSGNNFAFTDVTMAILFRVSGSSSWICING
jgi:hypothetical protein